MFVILTRKNSGFYTITKKDDLTIASVAYFLTDDVGGNINRWKEWLESTDDFTSSNASHLYKRDGNISIQTWWLSDNDGEEYKILFTANQFLYLLDQWEILRKLKSQEIIISLKNGNLTVEGHNPHSE